MVEKHPIVLVDDDEDDRYIFQEAFLQTECRNPFLQFENGSILLDFLNKTDPEHYPCLILLDLNMPMMDGREVLKNVKSNPQWSHIPVIVFTTSKLEKDRRIAYGLGANCFVSKPSGYHEVLEITRAIALLWCHK